MQVINMEYPYCHTSGRGMMLARTLQETCHLVPESTSFECCLLLTNTKLAWRLQMTVFATLARRSTAPVKQAYIRICPSYMQLSNADSWHQLRLSLHRRHGLRGKESLDLGPQLKHAQLLPLSDETSVCNYPAEHMLVYSELCLLTCRTFDVWNSGY